MPTNFELELELKQLKLKLDIVEKAENRVHKLTDSNVSRVPITTITLPKINLENLALLRPLGPQSQRPGGPCLHDFNLNTVSTQPPRGQEMLGHIKKEWQIKMMAVFFSPLMKRVLNFMRNPKLGHVLVFFLSSSVASLNESPVLNWRPR